MSAAHRAKFSQFLRFLVVGGSAAVSGWILLSALNAPINFLLHRRLTFGIGWRDRGAAS